MKLAIPRECVYRPHTGSVGRADQRRRCLTAWAEWIRWAAASSRRRIFEVSFPDDLAFLDIDGVEIVGNAGFESDLTNAIPRAHLVDDQGWKQRMHLPRHVIELQLPE